MLFGLRVLGTDVYGLRVQLHVVQVHELSVEPCEFYLKPSVRDEHVATFGARGRNGLGHQPHVVHSARERMHVLGEVSRRFLGAFFEHSFELQQ